MAIIVVDTIAYYLNWYQLLSVCALHIVIAQFMRTAGRNSFDKAIQSFFEPSLFIIINWSLMSLAKKTCSSQQEKRCECPFDIFRE